MMLMNGFKIYDGNAGEYDERTDTTVSSEWDIGVSLLLANIGDDVRVFAPRFNLLNLV